MILIDEWVAYARSLVARDDLAGGTFDDQFTFAQSLTEAVKGTPGVLLAISIPASESGDDAAPVAGNADILLFPDLTSANLTVKAIMYTADCRFGGVLWGASCPIVFMSRADTTATRLNSLALALALTNRDRQAAVAPPSP